MTFHSRTTEHPNGPRVIWPSHVPPLPPLAALFVRPRRPPPRNYPSHRTTRFDAILYTLRDALGASTDRRRAVFAAVLFLLFFPLPVFLPNPLSLYIAAYGLFTWCMLLLIEWEGPDFLSGRALGKLPEGLLGCLTGFGILSAARVLLHGVMVCTVWYGEAGAWSGRWPTRSIRVLAGGFLCFGIWLMADCIRKTRAAAQASRNYEQSLLSPMSDSFSFETSRRRPRRGQPGTRTSSGSELPPYSRPESPPPYSE